MDRNKAFVAYYEAKQMQYMQFFRYINLNDKENLTDVEKEELTEIKKTLILK